jgi:hypothetical protein
MIFKSNNAFLKFKCLSDLFVLSKVLSFFFDLPTNVDEFIEFRNHKMQQYFCTIILHHLDVEPPLSQTPHHISSGSHER